MRIQEPGHIRATRITSVGLGAMVALSVSGPALAANTWTDPVGDVKRLLDYIEPFYNQWP